MAAKHPKRPRDPSQLAKAIVDIATGQQEDTAPQSEDSPAKEFARQGGLKGGAARAAKLSPERRRDIAKAAAQKRWSSKDK
jgi:hypothetical protein